MQLKSFNVPHDIAIIILSKLPIKSLIRFKSVCKSWYSLINSQYFIRFHLNQSNDRRNLSYLIHDDVHIWSVSFPALTQVGEETGEMKYPFESETSSIAILGVVDGVFLLGVLNDSSVITNYTAHDVLCTCKQFDFSDVCIWNPSTREYRNLPDAFITIPKHRINCRRIIYGFGYDSVLDDYKVIRIFYYCDRIAYPESFIGYYESDVHIYSLKKNSFKRVQDIPYLVAIVNQIDRGVFLNGAVHWLGRPRSHEELYTYPIICFDVSSEEYRVIEMPEFRYSKLRCNVTFGELEGHLCVYLQFKDKCVDVYIMKEYGLDESWTKIFSIGLERSNAHFKVIRFTSTGEILCKMTSSVGCSYVFSYKPKEKSSVKLDIDGLPIIRYDVDGIRFSYDVQPYIRSLVSLK